MLRFFARVLAHVNCVFFFTNLCIQGMLKTYEITYDANGEETGDEFVRLHFDQLKKYICFKPAAKKNVRISCLHVCAQNHFWTIFAMTSSHAFVRVSIAYRTETQDSKEANAWQACADR